MIPELRVDGADRLATVSRALKQAPPELRRELARAIREGTEPAKKAAQANIAPTLPRRGGLAAEMSSDTTVATQRLGGRATPGIRLVARRRGRRNSNLRLMDRGMVRHPLFGNRSRWFTTNFRRPGWFSKPIADHMPEVRRELMRALDNVARKIGRS